MLDILVFDNLDSQHLLNDHKVAVLIAKLTTEPKQHGFTQLTPNT